MPLNFAHVSLDHDGLSLHLLVEVNSGRVVGGGGECQTGSAPSRPCAKLLEVLSFLP